MKHPSLKRRLGLSSGLALSCLTLALSSATSALASDRSFDRNSIIVISTDDVPASKRGMNASQYGAFMNEPAVKKLLGHLEAGVVSLVGQIMAAEMGPEEKAQADKVLALIGDYYTALNTNVTGSFSASLGYRQDGDLMQPDMILHFQGGDEFQALHDRIAGLMAESSQGMLERISSPFKLSNVDFTGVAFPPTPAQGPIMPPDGFWFGRSGNDYYVGISKRGLESYISANSGTSANRFGQTKIYQKAIASGVSGNSRMFLNMEPIWSLLPMIMQMGAGEEAAQVMSIMDALGVMEFGGLAAASQIGAPGVATNSFIALGERKGLMKILAGHTGPVTMPNFVPKDAIEAQLMRLDYGSILGVVREIAMIAGGERAVQEMDSGLAELKGEIGVDLAELFASMEGTTAIVGLPVEGEFNAASVMMDPSAALGRRGFGFKLKDPSVVQRFLSALSGNAKTGSEVRVESFEGRTIYTFGSESPPEFGAMAPPTPALTVDQDWLLVALKMDDLKAVIKTAAGASENRLNAQPAYQAMAGKAGGAGEMLVYQDAGKALGQGLDLVRGVLSMAGMFMPPEITQNPDLFYVLTPSNLPSNAMIEKYFGQSVSTGRMVDGGMVLKSWAPNPVKAIEKK